MSLIKHLLNSARLSLLLLAVVVSAVGCKTTSQHAIGPAAVADCFVIFDAGSSKTRLFIYERTQSDWLQHRGPTAGPLADPVRLIRGKTMADAEQLIEEIAGTLSGMRHDGPPGADGEPQWTAFDWPAKCAVQAAAVYATAGMRLAEQYDPEGSSLIWTKLHEKLAGSLDAPLTTRSLTGFEEGLFAWLAKSESRADANFGIAEMGGGSVQIAFPCPACEGARSVRVKERAIDIYSRSFLGWGQDEAWRDFGRGPECARGAGGIDPAWETGDCAAGMHGFANMASGVAGLVQSRPELQWYRTDVFRYMQDTDIENFCRKGLDSGFHPESSCFRAVYLDYVLRVLGVPPEAEPNDINWTLGAVVCAASRCLESP